MTASIRLACIALAVGALAACGDAAPEPAPAQAPAPVSPPASAPPASVPAASAPAASAPAASARAAAGSPLKATRWATATGFRCPAPDQGVVVDKVAYGDITGDGIEDAVVALTCTTTTSSNPLNVEAFDGASDPAHPRSLGVLIAFDDPFYVEKVNIAVTPASVALDGLGTGPDAPLAAGPTAHFTQSFTYRAGHLQAGPRHPG